MPLVHKLNRIKFTATTSGEADFGIGANATGFRTLNTAAGAVDTRAYRYTAILGASAFETGTGTFDEGGAILSRDTVHESSNAGAKVDFGSEPTVFITALAEDFQAGQIGFTPAGNLASTDVQAAIEELDGEKQPLAAALTTLAGAGNSSVLAATTASFLTADETKLDGIETGADVTDAANVAAAGAIMASLLTTRGDVIYRGASAPARLAKGTSGYVLTMNANDPEWAAPSGGGGQPIPTSSADVAVGVVLFMSNQGSSVSSDATIAGSSLRRSFDTSFITAGAPSGTWKNISGAAVGNNQFGSFVRTA